MYLVDINTQKTGWRFSLPAWFCRLHGIAQGCRVNLVMTDTFGRTAVALGQLVTSGLEIELSVRSGARSICSPYGALHLEVTPV